MGLAAFLTKRRSVADRAIWIDDIVNIDPTADARALREMWPSGRVVVSELLSDARVHAFERLTWVVRAEFLGEETAWMIALKCAGRALETLADSPAPIERDVHLRLSSVFRLVHDWIQGEIGDRQLECARRERLDLRESARGSGLTVRACSMLWCGMWLLKLEDAKSVGNVLFLARAVCAGKAVDGQAREIEAQIEIVREVLGIESGRGLEAR
jgi:hypothetical protein